MERKPALPEPLAEWFEAKRCRDTTGIAKASARLAALRGLDAQSVLSAIVLELGREKALHESAALWAFCLTVVGSAAGAFWHPVSFLQLADVVVGPALGLAVLFGLRENPKKRMRLAMEALYLMESPAAVNTLAGLWSPRHRSMPRGLESALSRALRRLTSEDGEDLSVSTLQELTAIVYKTRRISEKDSTRLELNLAICEALQRRGYAWIPYDELDAVAAMKPRNYAQAKLRDAAADCICEIARRRVEQGFPEGAGIYV